MFGVFGRLTRWKGQHVALATLRSLPGVHLAIVGEALFTEEDRAYRDELHRVAEEPGLQGRVHFLDFSPMSPQYFRLWTSSFIAQLLQSLSDASSSRQCWPERR